MQDFDRPKVSVLMPVYNTNENHLREAIESVLSQSFTNFEFLILNDSPENTALGEIVASYKDARIQYKVNERNLGITPSRNKLLEMARGEYLATMDHDDISLPERFAQQTAFLDANSSYGVVGCFAESFPQAGHVPALFENDTKIKLALMTSCAIVHPACMIRAAVLKQHSIHYEERFSPSEDYALFSRLIPHTRFYNIPRVLFRYRFHAENTSKTQAAQMMAACEEIHLFTRINNPSLYQEFSSKAQHVTRLYLFSCIPLLKMVRQSTKMKIYLFGCIPLFKTKQSIKLKH